MKAQTVANVALISIPLAPNLLLHHNSNGVFYVKTSNFKMDSVRSIPLHYVTMLHSTVIVTEAPFTTTLAHAIASMTSRP
jgi:hypothetical protein